MSDSIARAGLGLQLEGGASVIADLRTVHSLMSGIVSLAGSIPKGVGGVFEGPTQASSRQAKQGFDSHVQNFKQMEQGKTRILQEEIRKREKLDKEEAARARQARSLSPVANDQDVAKYAAKKQREADAKRRFDESEERSERARNIRRNAEVKRQQDLETYTYENQDKIRRARVSAGNNPLNPMRGQGARDVARRVEERDGLLAYDKSQSALFRKYRNDPRAINDPQTNAMRTEYARGVAAQRSYNKELERDNEAHYKRQIEEYRAYKNQMVREAASGPTIPDLTAQRNILRRSRNDPAAVNDPTTQRFRDETAVDIRAQRIQTQQRRAQTQQYEQAYQQRQAEDAALEARAREFRARRSAVRSSRDQRNIFGGANEQYDFNERRNYFRADAKIQSVAQGQNASALDDFMKAERAGRPFIPLNPPSSPPPPPSGPRGGGRGGRGGDPRQTQAQLRDPQGLFNEKGFFTTGDALGRITRNILLYQAVSGLTYGLGGYIQNAIKAAKTTVEFANALRFSTEQAGGNLTVNEELADSLLKVGLSRQQGRAAVTEAARFSQNRPRDTALLTTTVADIAASRGIGIDRTDELIEQLRRRESKFYKRIFGTTVEQVYENFATDQIGKGTTSRVSTPGLYIGEDKNKVQTRSQEISKYLSGMDDAKKEEAIYDYILSQSSRFAGEAAERADTLAGRLDKLSAAWLNGQEGLGLFITDLKSVNSLLDSTTGLVAKMDSLRGPTVGRSGQGGTIGTADLTRYSVEASSGYRARALREVDAVGLPGVATGLGLGALGLFGRTQAKEFVRLEGYTKAFDQYVTKFNGNVVAAQQEAINEARNLKPGLFRSVGEGMKRLTIGMTDSITGAFGGTPLSERFAGPTNFLSTRQVRSTLSADALSFGNRTGVLGDAKGPYSLLSNRNYTYSAGTNAPLRQDLGPMVQGPFSLLSAGRTPTITQAQLDKLQGIKTATAVGGGIAGGIAGAIVGSMIAEKLDVGPITAAGLTIGGAIIGNAAGTAIGQTIGGAIVGYIASVGGLGAIATGTITAATAGGIGAGVFAAGTAGGAILGGGIIGAGVLAAGALGVGIGAGVNYLNPYDALSNEQNIHDRQDAYGKAYAMREKEFSRANQENRVRYRDLNPGSGFNKLLSEREAKAQGGFEFGFDNPNRRYSREILPRTDPSLTIRSREDAVRQLKDAASTIGIEANPYRRVTNTLGTASQVFDATDLQKEIAQKVAGAKFDLESLQTAPQITGGEEARKKAIEDAKDQVSKLLDVQLRVNEAVSAEAKIRDYGTIDAAKIVEIEDYRARQAESTRLRKEKDDAARLKRASEIGNALSKLRDTQAGSFKNVGDVANLITGGNNPYVQVLSDSATLTERMNQVWDHIGGGVSVAGKRLKEFQLTLEQSAINVQKIRLQFETFSNIQRITTGSAQERADRNLAPGLSRRDQDAIDVQSARINKAVELPRLRKQAREALGLTPDNPIAEFQSRIAQLQTTLGLGAQALPNFQGVKAYGQYTLDANGVAQRGPELFTQGGGARIAGFNAGERQTTLIGPDGKQTVQTLDQGQSNDYAAYDAQAMAFGRLSPEVQKATRSAYADSVLAITQDYTPQQLKAAGLGGVVAGAFGIKAQGLDQQIEDAQKKAQYGAVSDAQLASDLKDQEAFRNKELTTAKLLPDGIQRVNAIRAIGAESDKLLLARTDNIAPKDLTYEQFTARQEAQKREAGREASKEADAALAVEEGKKFQGELKTVIESLRDALLKGDLKALIQIQNDTQARVDQSSLEEATSGKYNAPLDQGGTKSNPASVKSLQQRYSRKGYGHKGGF